jgi:hypothetical protein
MIGHAEEYRFDNESRWAYVAARVIVDHIHQPEGVEFRCHEIARVVARFVDATVIDGRCGMSEHSWITHRFWNPRTILDPYTVGRVPMVQLVDTFPTPTLYRADASRTDIDVALINQLLAAVGQWSGRIESALEHLARDARTWWNNLEVRRGKPWELTWKELDASSL